MGLPAIEYGGKGSGGGEIEWKNDFIDSQCGGASGRAQHGSMAGKAREHNGGGPMAGGVAGDLSMASQSGTSAKGENRPKMCDKIPKHGKAMLGLTMAETDMVA